MGENKTFSAGRLREKGWQRKALAGQAGSFGGYFMDCEDRCPLAGFTKAISILPDLSQTVSAVGGGWSF